MCFKASLSYKTISQVLNISTCYITDIIRRWKAFIITVNLARLGHLLGGELPTNPGLFEKVPRNAKCRAVLEENLLRLKICLQQDNEPKTCTQSNSGTV